MPETPEIPENPRDQDRDRGRDQDRDQDQDLDLDLDQAQAPAAAQAPVAAQVPSPVPSPSPVPVRTPAPALGSDELARRLLAVLVCAAVEPGLPGVLLFDLPPELTAPVTEVFAGLVGRAAGAPEGAGGPDRAVSLTTLGAATRDEDLWIRPRLARGPDGISFTLVPGPLTESPAGPSLVVVPDLARLSVSGMRAVVQLLGADVATVEHSGLRHRWRPRARWLAVCRAEDTERVPPHLLDRFPVRLSVAGLRTLPGTGTGTGTGTLPGTGTPSPGTGPHGAPLSLPLGDSATDPGDRFTDPLGPLPDAWRAALAPGASRPPLALAEELAPRVLELLGPDAGHRRALALARIARALTRLDGATEVTAARADEAARLIGLPGAPLPSVPAPAPGPGLVPPEPPRPGDRPGRAPRRTDRGPDGQRRMPTGRPVLAPEPAESIGPGPAPEAGAPATPYPEDRTTPSAESASLRTPWPRAAGPASTRGPVIGVRRSHDLRDLAFVRTAMEAAKYQAVRGNPARLAIAPGDLRGYARAPEPERLLALVLDHTCRSGRRWRDALEPFLQWAYVSRASAHVVEVGRGDAVSELRAESFAARSVLDPRITAALVRPPGRATPLAHGLDQAAQALRRAFQHHRAGLVEAWLVVVTDGRGNVPLDASRRGRTPDGPVGRTGVEDALAVAARIGGMDRTRLHSVVLDPLRLPYAELPHLLADALGGTVIEGRATTEAVTDDGW
ncbi:hypothetical protein AB0O64_21620 [Streptomyces sp. NPDC088341]|uniref:hypothetical protein n=1 Tax=Streptomyces sp. NPDC088341 TaxID=3154870 RepID=UPI0034313CBD